VAESTDVPVSAEFVRPLELFFDLVFVFAITQISSVLAARPTFQGLTRVMALLGITWWMYGGWAWLTNAVDLTRPRPRLLVLSGMAAFFAMSLAVPRSFEPGGWGLMLGISYLFVVLLHSFGFLGTSGHRGITRLSPLNLTGALVVVAAGAGPERFRLWGLALACLVLAVSPFIAGVGGFTVGVGHFVERHALAVIILLGESIVEIGSATSRQHDPVAVVAGSLLALALPAAMWWLYFEREDRDTEELLGAVEPQRRSWVALCSYGYAYYIVVLGIVITAVGAQKAIDALSVPLRGLSAALLPLGAALFLLGLACFHRVMVAAWQVSRLLAALACAAGYPAARWGGGWLALAVVTAVLALLALVDIRSASATKSRAV
jgi:low temperature requirement protein LtrA